MAFCSKSDVLFDGGIVSAVDDNASLMRIKHQVLFNPGLRGFAHVHVNRVASKFTCGKIRWMLVWLQ